MQPAFTQHKHVYVMYILTTPNQGEEVKGRMRKNQNINVLMDPIEQRLTKYYSTNK